MDTVLLRVSLRGLYSQSLFPLLKFSLARSVGTINVFLHGEPSHCEQEHLEKHTVHEFKSLRMGFSVFL